MKTIPNPICPAAFVGMRVPIDESRGFNTPFHVEDGTAQVEVAPNDPTATPAERAMGRRVVRMQKLPPPPYAITEDTTILGGIFRQETPHTPIFTVAPGVRLVIQGDGQYVNCTLPDEAEIVGFPNLSHGVEAATGDPERPTVRLLCACSKCVTAQAELEEIREATKDMNGLQQIAHEVALGTRDPDGRRVHSRPGKPSLKERFRARRKNATRVESDRMKQMDANLAALKRHDPNATMSAPLRVALREGM